MRSPAALGRLWSWWLDEFCRLWPEALVDWLSGRNRKRLWLTPQENGLLIQAATTARKVLYQSKVSWESYASAGLGGCCRFDCQYLERVLALPECCFFQRSFTVPALAIARLDHLARQAIERRTPFCLEDIFTHSRASRDPADKGRFQICQLIVRKDIVEESLARVDLGIHAFSFIAIESHGRSLDDAIPLTSTRSNRRPLADMLLRALIMIGVILMLSALAATWWRRQSMIDDMVLQLEVIQPKAQSVRQMMDFASRSARSIEALLDRRRSPSALAVWEEMSRLLPDDSWLTEFRIDDDRISISGLSANAAALVDIVSKSKLLSDVALSAPITSDPAAKRDRFSLTANIVGRRREK